MSAFLGPIHYWLYRKIQLQEALIDHILDTAAQQGWDTLSAEKLNTACGAADLRPLEEVIDQGNIHGWLHQKIGVSEVRLAYLVTELLKADAARLDTLKVSVYRFGERHAMLCWRTPCSTACPATMSTGCSNREPTTLSGSRPSVSTATIGSGSAAISPSITRCASK